jgi:plasmid stabilization system protein ParE
LWDSISDDSAEVPATSYQARVLDERLDAMESDPSVFFRLGPGEIIVVAVLHQKRNPAAVRRRLH